MQKAAPGRGRGLRYTAARSGFRARREVAFALLFLPGVEIGAQLALKAGVAIL
jgi:hypothetical protein